MDVVVWLRSLGLGKYEAAFRENEIDETVLPSLTHETLKELVVASFGHRVKLLDDQLDHGQKSKSVRIQNRPQRCGAKIARTSSTSASRAGCCR